MMCDMGACTIIQGPTQLLVYDGGITAWALDMAI